MLHTAVNEHHLLSGTLIVANNLFAAYAVHEVDSLIICLRDVVGFIIEENLSHHDTVFAQHLGELTSVDTRDARHLFAL